MALLTAAECCGSAGSCMSGTVAVQACCALRRHLANCRWSQAHNLSGRGVLCHSTSCCSSRPAVVGTKHSCGSQDNSSSITELSQTADCRGLRWRQDKQTKPMSQNLLATIAIYAKGFIRVGEDGVLAYNIKDTSLDKPPFGNSWLGLFKIILHMIVCNDEGLQCAVVGCTNPAQVGAHVAVPSDGKDSGCRWTAIAGFCRSHNNCKCNRPTDYLHLKPNSPLVLIPAQPFMDIPVSLHPSTTHSLLSRPTIGQQYVVAVAAAGGMVAHQGLVHKVMQLTAGMAQEVQQYRVVLALQLEEGPAVLLKAGLYFERGLEQATKDWPQISQHMLQLNSVARLATVAKMKSKMSNVLG